MAGWRSSPPASPSKGEPHEPRTHRCRVWHRSVRDRPDPGDLRDVPWPPKQRKAIAARLSGEDKSDSEISAFFRRHGHGGDGVKAKPLNKGEVKRAKGRAKRLGVDLKGPVSRNQAKSLRTKLATKREARNYIGRSGVNRVASGAGSQRAGKSFQVAYNRDKGAFQHVYGGGKAVTLSAGVAKSYGYKAPKLKKRLAGGRKAGRSKQSGGAAYSG